MSIGADAPCRSVGLVQPGVPPSVTVLSLARARQAFKALETGLMSEEACQLPLHDVEREQERQGREIQRVLLEAHLVHRGPGDVGPAIAVQPGAGAGEPVLHTQHRMDTRHPQTLFGEITVERLGYCHPGQATVHPLDAQVQLPARSFSYEVQRRLVEAAVQGPFDEAIARIADATGVGVPKRSVEQIVQDAARDVEMFYRTRRPPPPAQTGPLLVGSVDGKGIPMVKPQRATRVVRRGKGEKANKKKMAVVAAVYTQRPRVRTPDAVIAHLFPPEPCPTPPPEASPVPPIRPEYKRVWASLAKGKAGVLDELAQEMARRDPQAQKQWLMLTDGERALQQAVRARLADVPLVLDFQHVLAKLWQVAYVFHDEGSPQAKAWVQHRAGRLLHGEVSQVVKGMRQSATKRHLSGQKRKTLETAAAYFYRNRTHMRYHEYLQQGWPIATGVVEGACKNLVKDRMERSGMRWTPTMAEAMLQLRATYLSGDFAEDWAFHVHQEHERLHPSDRWWPVNIVEEK